MLKNPLATSAFGEDVFLPRNNNSAVHPGYVLGYQQPGIWWRGEFGVEFPRTVVFFHGQMVRPRPEPLMPYSSAANSRLG